MALVLKNRNEQGHNPNVAHPAQWLHVKRATASLPASTAANIFQVRGGRVLVKLLFGEVTTIIQAQATTLKISSTAKDSAGTTIGTAVDVTATVDINALEVGGFVFAEGDGTALVKSNAGAAFVGPNSGHFIAPQGYLSHTTGATSTGAIKYDLFYQPLDEGADVVPV